MPPRLAPRHENWLKREIWRDSPRACCRAAQVKAGAFAHVNLPFFFNLLGATWITRQCPKVRVPGMGKVDIKHSFGSRIGKVGLGQYRLYFLDSIDRLISQSLEFEAASDGAAVQAAETMREGRPAELWRGARKLKAWVGAGSSEREFK